MMSPIVLDGSSGGAPGAAGAMKVPPEIIVMVIRIFLPILIAGEKIWHRLT